MMAKLALAAVGFILATQPVNGQVRMCGPYDAITSALQAPQYRERRAGFGVVAPAGHWRMELWFSITGNRTWSLVAINGTGLTCMVSNGTFWEQTVGEPASHHEEPESQPDDPLDGR